MQLQFRQGIVRTQIDIAGTANFIRENGSDNRYIDLICDNGPVIFTLAHANNDYLIEINKTFPKAWGPTQAHGQTQYLYWDVSLLDATVTYGLTTIYPYFGQLAPTSPQVDQHWFDVGNNLMKVWNGTKWVVKLRVFAGVYNNAAVVIPNARGSQVGLNTTCDAGNIILGRNNYPLHDADGTFVTSESKLVIGHTSAETVRFEAALLYAEATVNIPEYSLVSYIAPRKVKLASYLDTNFMVNGIMTKGYFIGEVGNVISNGLIRNEQWDFSLLNIGQPLFCGANGEVTLTPPLTGVSQEIGYVYDIDTIYLNIQQPIIM
jgi:hypothetical protein